MKNRTYKIRFSDDEWRKLEAQAGGNVAKYIRSKLFPPAIKGLTRGGQPVVLQSKVEDDPSEDKTIHYITGIECMKCGKEDARKRKDRGNLCDTCFNG